MKIDVAQYRRYDRTLLGSFPRVTNITRFHYSCLEPFVYHPSYNSILYPFVKEFPENTMIDAPKVVFQVCIYYIVHPLKTNLFEHVLNRLVL